MLKMEHFSLISVLVAFVASIVDDGLIVELEIADVANDAVVVCPGGRC
jgi:hypothetical protein